MMKLKRMYDMDFYCFENTHSIQTRRGLWPQAAFWVLCLICDKQIVDIFEMYPQRAQQAGGISKGSL